VNNSPEFARLFRNTLIALLLCAALVLLCYLFVDRPFAFFIHDERLADYPVLKWLIYLPSILQAWTPVVLAVLMVRRVYGPFRRWELTIVAACVGIVLAEQFRLTLGYAFGRYWPITWIKDNPSLIRDGVYGFHPFHGGIAYGSFPSGVIARTLAMAAIVWIAYPRWRWACALGCLAVAASLLWMDYHFVGDVIAGAFVGSIIGAYTAHCTGLAEAPMPPAGRLSEPLRPSGPTRDGPAP
jgi:membrane-associated phospholipid phosphatase